MKTFIVLTFFSCSLFGSNLALAFEAEDLVGVWTLCVDPDGSPKDSLLFENDGTGYVLLKDKPSKEFLYRVEGSSLMLLARVGKQAIPISLEISPDGRKLLLYSDRTKNTSFYVRESDIAEFDCDTESGLVGEAPVGPATL